MSEALREAFRTLLLPIDPAREQEALNAADDAMDEAGIEASDRAELIRSQLARARLGEGFSPALMDPVRAALRVGDPVWGLQLARSYEQLHEALVSRHLLSFEESSAFLSHSRLIARLAAAEAMSAAQIAGVLSARDHRVPFSWQAVQDVLARLGLRRALDATEVEALHARDEELEELLFADADFQGAAAIVGRVGADFGFPGDLEDLLLRLFRPDPDASGRHGPYLQILHYQCVVAEFFDHALTALYEFAPRGAVAEWVFARYPGDLSGAGNPFLNNAKSVDRLDSAWARSKDRQGLLSPASALVGIVSGLEVMGFAARQELAAWLRRWLLRVIRLTRPLAREVPEWPTPGAVAALLRAIAADQTRTAGILEQRIVDAIALARHGEADGWRSHGIGDSVNASNISRRKLGDCEFQNASERRVVAYEAHAGILSQVYVDGHAQTLSRVLPTRIEEWERIADLNAWQVKVVFVAHSFSCLPTNLEIDGMNVVVEFVEYSDFLAEAPAPGDLADLFATHVNARLNEPRTPLRVRETYLQLTD
jgi:hypothetical protein